MEARGRSRNPWKARPVALALPSMIPVIAPDDLPAHLAERVRPLNPTAVEPEGDLVLYWMRNAVRGHENPALDVALSLAERLGNSVLVYQALPEGYPYASDRHHTFILEGARDVQQELAGRRIPYAFHLERAGHRGVHLAELARRSAMVITEDMPALPLAAWIRRLADTAPVAVWAVDTACVLPMIRVGREHDRAFAFRRATQAAREERLRQAWPELEVAALPPIADLPFEPLDLQAASIPDLVAQCNIDHTVGPVPDTPGGSRAGYRRWQLFRDGRLRDYGRRRNDPMQRDAVSRLSAYLHHGHVSPLRIAREAAEQPDAGTEKFLDELLVWREMAHVFCLHRPDHDTTAALPGWARESLRAAELDMRPARYGWETLARGATGDALWNAAQRSLLIHGELHNNLRMTWGKEVLRWSGSAEEALDRLLDLNHRYALDGQDPNSYGGILWCLGQFDRPFDPPRPVFGRVRPRSTRDHARRIDVGAYAARIGRPASGQVLRIAVIGAGMAGLTCARVLADQGHAVTVLDKGRGVGGRITTRREGGLVFDHGAQYLTAKDPRFRRHVDSWIDEGVAASWTGTIVKLRHGAVEPTSPSERIVGVPGMSAVMRHLSRGLEIRSAITVTKIARDSAAWRLEDSDGSAHGPFDRVLVALPAPQAAPLLGAAPGLAAAARSVEMAPCWSVLAAFPEPIPAGLDGAFVQDSPLGWIARDRSRPRRDAGGPETWVLHATPDWSAAHLEEPAETIAGRLLAALGPALGLELPGPAHRSAHRWRYAQACAPLGKPCLYEPEQGLGACGDWCLGMRIEAAFLSGAALAGRMLGTAPVALGEQEQAALTEPLLL